MNKSDMRKRVLPSPGRKWTILVMSMMLLFIFCVWIMSLTNWIYYAGRNCRIGIISGRIDITILLGDKEHISDIWKYNLHIARSFTTFPGSEFCITRPKLNENGSNVERKLYAGKVRALSSSLSVIGFTAPYGKKLAFPAFSLPLGISLPPVNGITLVIPLWIPFLVVLVGIIVFVRFLWLHGPLSCRFCKYCLIGNMSGTCPECGTLIPEDQRETIAATTST